MWIYLQSHNKKIVLSKRFSPNFIIIVKTSLCVRVFVKRMEKEPLTDDGTADGSGDFLRALGAKTDVAVVVTDDDVGLEAGALTSAGLLLDGGDLHDLVLELGEEVVNDLVLLDGEREQEDLLNALDLAVLDQATLFVSKRQSVQQTMQEEHTSLVTGIQGPSPSSFLPPRGLPPRPPRSPSFPRPRPKPVEHGNYNKKIFFIIKRRPPEIGTAYLHGPSSHQRHPLF